MSRCQNGRKNKFQKFTTKAEAVRVAVPRPPTHGARWKRRAAPLTEVFTKQVSSRTTKHCCDEDGSSNGWPEKRSEEPKRRNYSRHGMLPPACMFPVRPIKRHSCCGSGLILLAVVNETGSGVALRAARYTGGVLLLVAQWEGTGELKGRSKKPQKYIYLLL